MSATVRSVKVRLEADVAKYIADMQAAAAATRAAFDGRNLGGGGNNSGVQQQERAVQSLTDRTRNLSTANRDARRELDQFRASTAAMRTEVDQAAAALRGLGRQQDDTGRRTRAIGNEFDRMSGRFRIIRDLAVTIGPALLPLGASLVPTLTGVTAGLGAAAAGAGVLALAFHGVGAATKALNAYQLDPTTENLKKLNQAMDNLGPSGARFVQYIDSLTPQLDKLEQLAGRSGLFSGLQSGIGSLMTMLPTVSQIVARVSAELGRLSSQGGASLANDSDWRAFFQYIKTDAAPTLDAFARSIGNFAAGIGSMIRGFAPLSRGFADGILDMSRSFRNWAADTDNFQGFIDYVQKVGPQAKAFFSALVDAVSGLAQAMAPWGSAVLPILTNVTELFAILAKSPIGPVLFTAAAGMIAFNRAMAIAGSGGMTRVSTGLGTIRSSLATLPRQAAIAAAGLSAAMTSAADRTEAQSRRIAVATRLAGRYSGALRGGALIGGTLLAGSALTQTNKAAGVGLGAASGALIGTSIDPGLGTAIGAGVGALAGFVSSLHNASSASDDLAADWSGLGATLTASGRTTASTLADIASQFSKTGTLAAGQKYGLTPEQIIGAVTGPKSQYNATLSQLASGIGAKDFSGNKIQDLAFIDGGIKGTDQYKKFKADVDKARAALGLETAAQKAANDAADASVDSYKSATAALHGYMDAQEKLHQKTVASIDKQTAFGQALHDAQVQAKNGADGFSAFTKAGRENRTAMSGLIGAYNNQTRAVKNNVKGYRDVKREVEQLGHQMGLTKGQIKTLTDAIDKPKKLDVDAVPAAKKIRDFKDKAREVANLRIDPKIDANNKPAMAQSQKVADQLSRLDHTTATPTINVHDNASGPIDSIYAGLGRINGYHASAYITTTHLDKFEQATRQRAGGGYVRGPGTTTSDSIPARLSDREYVIRAAAVDKYGVGFFDRLNEMRFADGGYVQRFASGGVAHASSGVDRQAQLEIWHVSAEFKKLNAELKATTAALQKERDTRRELMSTVKESITLDPFGGDQNIWASKYAAGSIGYFEQQKKTTRANANRLVGYVKTLRRKGASDALISEILSSPDPVSEAALFAAESRSRIASQNRLEASTARAVNAAGSAAGAVYTDNLNRMEKRLNGIEAAIKQGNHEAKTQHDQAQGARAGQARDIGREIGREINGAAAAGMRRAPKHGTARWKT